MVRSAATEGDVRVLGAADVECERVVENVFIAIGRAEHCHHPLTLRNRHAVHLDVDLRAARPERHRRSPAQHLLDGVRPDGFVLPVALDLLGVADEGLKPGGQRVLGGVAAGECDDEEEDLQFVGRDRQLLAVLGGDDRGGQRAPDVVGGIAPLLRGEFGSVGEDLAEQFHRVLRSDGVVRRCHFENAIERVEDLGPVLFGNADDVTDDRHRQHVGDLVDPVAPACREQPVHHSRGAPANAFLQLANGLWREGVRHHPSPLEEIRWVHVDDGRRRADDAHTLDERPVGGGEGVGVAVDALGMSVLGGHPEVPLDGLRHAVGQLVVEQRPIAAQLGEQLVGKAVLPQGGI